MAWQVIMDDEFKLWIESLETHQVDKIFGYIKLLEHFGPKLGRPRVDTIKGSKVGNLKELRIPISGDPWRVLFAFDPSRRAILLVGGNKRGDDRWYEVNIPIAEKRLSRYLS